MNGNLTPISEPELRTRLLRLSEQVCDTRPDRLSRQWLKRHDLTAVPLEGGLPCGAVIAPLQRIWRAYSEYASTPLYVVVLGVEPEEPRELYLVGENIEDLAHISKEVSWANWLLTPESGTHLILVTTGEHYVVAGPEAFVKQAIRCKPTTAYRRWCEFAEHFSGRDEYPYYLDVAEHYEEFVQPRGTADV
jgi:hypothetical protein